MSCAVCTYFIEVVAALKVVCIVIDARVYGIVYCMILVLTTYIILVALLLVMHIHTVILP